MPVFILSPGMLRPKHYRQKLVKATPSRNLPGRMAFHICRGITSADIRAQYPDLRQLFLDVMVGDEVDLPTMVEELRAYIEHSPDRVGLAERLWMVARLLGANVMYWVGAVGYYGYFVAFPIALGLVLSLLLSSGRPGLETAAACYVLYCAGYGTNLVRPLDLWPWLGPAWCIGARPLGGHADSVRALSGFMDAIGPWQRMADAARLLRFGALCWLVIPGASALVGSDWAWAGIAAFVFGLTMPQLWSATLQFFTRRAYWQLGMTDEEMRRTARFFSSWGLDTATAFEYRYRGTRGGQLVHRPWLPRPPNVFISYAWRDEERTPVARTLEHTISAMGIPCFLDTRRIPGKFASWRTYIVNELLDCTHFFVVLGPNVREAKVMHREIRTALQRWSTGLEPAVICAVEPGVAAALAAEDISPELEYLLHEAPKITYAEAARSDVVARLLSQRRRQGLWYDWLTLLWPAKRLRQFLESEWVEGEELQS